MKHTQLSILHDFADRAIVGLPSSDFPKIVSAAENALPLAENAIISEVLHSAAMCFRLGAEKQVRRKGRVHGFGARLVFRRALDGQLGS